MSNEVVKCPICRAKVADNGLEFIDCPFCHCTFQRPRQIDAPKLTKREAAKIFGRKKEKRCR